jgi:hypothetical protein
MRDERKATKVIEQSLKKLEKFGYIHKKMIEGLTNFTIDPLLSLSINDDLLSGYNEKLENFIEERKQALFDGVVGNEGLV